MSEIMTEPLHGIIENTIVIIKEIFEVEKGAQVNCRIFTEDHTINDILRYAYEQGGMDSVDELCMHCKMMEQPEK